MDSEQHKLLIRQVFEQGINQRKLELIDALFSPTFVDHSTPEQEPGTQGVKDYFQELFTGFPDLQVTINDLLAEGDSVAVRTTWNGTHLGSYYENSPTGKQTTRTLLQIFRVVDGQIAEEWNEGAGLLS